MRSPRLFSSVIASVVALAQIGATAHLALARHAVCAEHGELVEASASSSPRVADALDGVETHFDAGEAVEISEHDHCLASILTRASATSARPAAFATPVLASLSPWLPELPSVSAGRGLIRLAPKQSPPAV